MKKLLYLILSFFLLMVLGCSKNDNEEVKSPSITVIVNGIEKKFYNTTITRHGQFLEVLALNENGTETLTFFAEMGYLSGDRLFYVEYMKDGRLFNETATGVVSEVALASETHLKATFSGDLATTGNWGTTIETLTLVEGSVDVTYQVD